MANLLLIACGAFATAVFVACVAEAFVEGVAEDIERAYLTINEERQ